jgi:hypothetical protein
MIMHFNVLCECMENKVINNFVVTRTITTNLCSLPYDKSLVIKSSFVATRILLYFQ